jgi:hypothetical protein
MRTFIRCSRAWYAEANRIGAAFDHKEEFILSQGVHDQEDDVPQIEIVVVFDTLGQNAGSPARLCIFDESWQALVGWRDLWDALAREADEGGGMSGHFTCTPDRLQEILENCGFEDKTETTRGGAHA